MFPAGPQPRVFTPSVPCRTSTASIHAKCSLPDLYATIDAKCSVPDLNREYSCQVFPAGPQPRVSTPSVSCRTSTATIQSSVPCRTSTATIHAQCSLPDLNREYPRLVFPAGPQPRPRPMFPAGPQPRPSTPSVPCRTSTATISAKCCRPDLDRDHPRPDRMSECMPNRMPE